MNQTYHNMSPVGVGAFHKPFPPSFSIGIIPNPNSHSNPREIKEFLCIISSKKGIPSLLVSPLAYNIRGMSHSYLTTVSRGNISFTSPLDAPADNYTKDYYNYKNVVTIWYTGDRKKECMPGNRFFNFNHYHCKATYLT